MIHVICGPNAFAAQERTQELTDAYLKKSSSSISSFSEENFSAETFEIALRHSGLFQEQKIIIAKNILSLAEARQIVSKTTPHLQENSIVLILQEDNIDAALRQKMQTYISPEAFEEYPLLSSKKIASWFKSHAEKKNANISDQEIDELISAHGTNQWMLDTALELHILGAKHAESRQEDGKIIFRLLDAVTDKKIRDAFVLYHQILLSGASPEDVFWKLYWQFKNLLTVSRYEHLSPAAIKEKTSLHPFVIKKAGWALKRFTQQELESIFEWLITLWQDDKIKTRNLPGELELFFLTMRPHALPSRFL